MTRRFAWNQLWSQAVATPRRGQKEGDEKAAGQPHWTAYLADPRTAVLVVLGSVIGLGGGRRLWLGWQSKQAIEKLAEEDPTVADVENATWFGRDGLIDFFRLLEQGKTPEVRAAAGKAIAQLWLRDDLIAEEEKALVRRGCEISWIGRRRYPRGLTEPIELQVAFDVPFLEAEPEEGGGISSANLEWSFRINGANRASLEIFSPWQPLRSQERPSLQIDPRDFVGNGPHRLVLQVRVRTRGLKDAWEFELPHIPFSFEFDPILDVAAICGTPDDTRAEQVAASVRLVENDAAEASFVPLTPDFMLRNPPFLAVADTIPSDLAHRVEVEFEEMQPRVAAGQFVSTEATRGHEQPKAALSFTQPANDLPVERPGTYRMRAHLKADPHLAWGNAQVRSLWPRELVTNWVSVQVVRR